MGVKSTVELTKPEAIGKLHMLCAVVAEGSNEQLEDVLMHLNDIVKGGEGFENYQIVSSHE